MTPDNKQLIDLHREALVELQYIDTTYLRHKEAIKWAIAELKRLDAVVARLGDEKSFTDKQTPGPSQYNYYEAMYSWHIANRKARIQYARDNR